MTDCISRIRMAVSGPTGSGKSSATRLMATQTGVFAVNERVSSHLLGQLDINARAVCFQLQSEIMKHRQESEGQSRAEAIIVRDRTVDEDFHIFSSLFHSLGLVTDNELLQLKSLSHSVTLITGEPDLYILMEARKEMLLSRMHRAKTPKLILANLDDQLELYERWAHDLVAPKLRIDTTQLTTTDLADICAWAISSAEAVLNGDSLQKSKFGYFWE